MHRLVLALLLVIAASGCGPEETRSGADTPPATPEATAPPSTPASPPVADNPPVAAPDQAAESPAALVSARVKVVDLTGTPLAQMAPIVTRQPNAFDQPVATGTATGATGQGTIRFTAAEPLYLRAWDPALNYFPNNFFEVLPGGGAIEDELVIQMVPAAALEAQFFLPSGEPAASQTVRLMLLHPTRGPWWPTEVQTDAEGAARFPNLPAGEFVLRFMVETGSRLEQEQTALPPGSSVNLGVLTLQ